MRGFPGTTSGHRIQARVGWGIAMFGAAADGCLWKGTGARLKVFTKARERGTGLALAVYILFFNQLISITSVAAAAAASARIISFSAIA
jgi:hypothetical protein